jgi:hypothetical protein
MMACMQGPLGPETLKSQHGLDEHEVLRLYRVMYLFTAGFCSSVLQPLQRAHNREALLERIILAYAQLWDEAVGVRSLPPPLARIFDEYSIRDT